MTNSAISIHALNDGRFQTSYVNPVTRKRKRQKFDRAKDAQNFKIQIERELLSKNYSYFMETYVGQLVEQHLKDCPETKIKNRQVVFRSFCDEFRTCKFRDLSRQRLKNWFDRIQRENNYSERTLGSIKSEINWLFRGMIDDGLIEESPLSKIKFKRNVAPKRPRVVLSVDEVNSILADAQNFCPHGLFPYLSAVAHTGARRSEILRLTPQDIDFETNLIHIKKSKNGRDRFIRISPTLRGILKTNIDHHGGAAIFVNEHARTMNSNKELERVIAKFKAFFPTDKVWGCHSLRHSFAYNFLKKGGQMYQLQAILGHRSIDVTVDLYGQLQAQDVACPSPYESTFGEK